MADASTTVRGLMGQLESLVGYIYDPRKSTGYEDHRQTAFTSTTDEMGSTSLKEVLIIGGTGAQGLSVVHCSCSTTYGLSRYAHTHRLI
jgi:hypothetical protein